MQNIKGEELNLCPNNKKNCIFNKKHWNTGKPKKCFDCLKSFAQGEQKLKNKSIINML